MKLIFGLKLPDEVVENSEFKVFTLEKIPDSNFTIFGKVFEESTSSFIKMDDKKMIDMNEFSQLNINSDTEKNEFAEDIEKVLSIWNTKLEEIIGKDIDLTKEEIIEKYSYLEFPETLDFDWYIVNDR